MDSPEQQEPTPLSLEQKLAGAQQQAEHWAKLAAHPDLNPQQAAVALNAARSSRAAIKAGQKAQAWQSQQDNPLLQGDDAALAQTLQLPLNSSPPDQQNLSEEPNPDSSTSPGTSGSKTSPT